MSNRLDRFMSFLDTDWESDEDGWMYLEVESEWVLKNHQDLPVESLRLIADALARYTILFAERSEEDARAANEPATRTAFPGYVYLMRGPDGLCKIGKSNNPSRRAEDLSLPGYPVQLLHSILVLDARRCEQALHRRYQDRWVGKEWFRLEHGQVLEFQSFTADDVEALL